MSPRWRAAANAIRGRTRSTEGTGASEYTGASEEFRPLSVALPQRGPVGFVGFEGFGSVGIVGLFGSPGVVGNTGAPGYAVPG
jgi:hypothetical protein